MQCMQTAPSIFFELELPDSPNQLVHMPAALLGRTLEGDALKESGVAARDTLSVANRAQYPEFQDRQRH